MSHFTHILSPIEAGDPSAAEQLLPLVYDELSKPQPGRKQADFDGEIPAVKSWQRTCGR